MARIIHEWHILLFDDKLDKNLFIYFISLEGNFEIKFRWNHDIEFKVNIETDLELGLDFFVKLGA